MRTFYLITNVSDMKYWSYLATAETVGSGSYYAEAIKRHGNIYINRRGGWMPANCAKVIHKTVTQAEWPNEGEE